MLFAVEGGGFFSSSASGYSKGLTLLLLGRKNEEIPMRVSPWNQYRLVEHESDPDPQLDSGKNLVSRGCAPFVCFGRASAGLEASSPLKVGPVQQQDVLVEPPVSDKVEDCTTDHGDDEINLREVSLKSSLKKPSNCVPIVRGDGDLREPSGEKCNDAPGCTEIRKVQWTDACGGELVEIREFELRNSKADGPLRRPVAPPLREPSSPLKPIPPSPSPAPSLSPSPAPSKPVSVTGVSQISSQNVITLEFQRKMAKELQEYFRQKKLEDANQGPFFGFIGKNEIANGSNDNLDILDGSPDFPRRLHTSIHTLKNHLGVSFYFDVLDLLLSSKRDFPPKGPSSDSQAVHLTRGDTKTDNWGTATISNNASNATKSSPIRAVEIKLEASVDGWAMFGFAVGLLTEYATGSDFVDQLKILLSNFGIIDLE
ncbi:hypothetical protein HHK36_004155 [Tetracentron sinense]|uniref:Uncharacterized protein n=1 Tax=Tetracentron sinense TaxID=13715 RepID=A0A835DP78_TETSI|nr:hypothetical protein HHK36_004155 [Tetracentron sinense]